MTKDTTFRTGSATSWLLAAAATCAFVFGMFPATLLAHCQPKPETSCCCSSKKSGDTTSAKSHDCAEAHCDCHVAPADQVPVPLDQVVDATPSPMTALPQIAPTLVEPRAQLHAVRSTPPRGDPLPLGSPIYLTNQVFLL